MPTTINIAYQSQGPPWVLCWHALDEHVSLRCDNGRVDEAKEKEPANEGTNGIVRRVRIFSLKILIKVNYAITIV